MKLLFSDYGSQANELIQAALQAAEPSAAVRRALHRDNRQLRVGDLSYDLNGGRVYLVSVGKAAIPMAVAAVSVLGDDLAGGVVLTKEGGSDRPFC